MRKVLAFIFFALICGVSVQAEGVPEINEMLLRDALRERMNTTEFELRNLEIVESKKEKGDFQICGEVKKSENKSYTPFLVYIVNMEKYSVMDISSNARKLCKLVKYGEI